MDVNISAIIKLTIAHLVLCSVANASSDVYLLKDRNEKCPTEIRMTDTSHGKDVVKIFSDRIISENYIAGKVSKDGKVFTTKIQNDLLVKKSYAPGFLFINKLFQTESYSIHETSLEYSNTLSKKCTQIFHTDNVCTGVAQTGGICLYDKYINTAVNDSDALCTDSTGQVIKSSGNLVKARDLKGVAEVVGASKYAGDFSPKIDIMINNDVLTIYCHQLEYVSQGDSKNEQRALIESRAREIITAPGLYEFLIDNSYPLKFLHGVKLGNNCKGELDTDLFSIYNTTTKTMILWSIGASTSKVDTAFRNNLIAYQTGSYRNYILDKLQKGCFDEASK